MRFCIICYTRPSTFAIIIDRHLAKDPKSEADLQLHDFVDAGPGAMLGLGIVHAYPKLG